MSEKFEYTPPETQSEISSEPEKSEVTNGTEASNRFLDNLKNSLSESSSKIADLIQEKTGRVSEGLRNYYQTGKFHAHLGKAAEAIMLGEIFINGALAGSGNIDTIGLAFRGAWLLVQYGAKRSIQSEGKRMEQNYKGEQDEFE